MHQNLSWYQVDRGASIIAVKMEKIHGRIPPVDYIVGITPGGLVPAMVLSELWGKPMVAVGLNDGDGNITVLPPIMGPRISGTGVGYPSAAIFIVNHETTRAMNMVVAHYRRLGHPWMSASLFHREEGDGLRPDVFWRILEESDTVKYPWEN